MIVRDEARCLARCLESVRGVADQIVVVDTGSTDQTVEIARSFGAEVHPFAWCDDFSAARNESLRHAKGAWVFNLDADEVFFPNTAKVLFSLIRRHPTCRAFRPLMVSDTSNSIQNARVFRREGVTFRYRIHEQPVFQGRIIESLPAPELKFWHDGHTEAVKEEKGKRERNLRIAKLDVETYPGDAHALMSYLWALMDIDPTSEDVVNVGHDVRTRFGMRDERSTFLLFRAHRARGEEAKAQAILQETFDAGLRHRYFMFEQAKYLAAHSRFAEALNLLDEALAVSPEADGNPEALTRVLMGLRGFALEGLLRFDESLAQYRQVLSLDPADRNAGAGLKRVEEKLRLLRTLS